MRDMNAGWTVFTAAIVAATVAVILTAVILFVYDGKTADSEPASPSATIAGYEIQRVLESIRTDEEIHQGRCYRLMATYLDRDTRDARETFEAIAEEGCWPTP